MFFIKIALGFFDLPEALLPGFFLRLLCGVKTVQNFRVSTVLEIRVGDAREGFPAVQSAAKVAGHPPAPLPDGTPAAGSARAGLRPAPTIIVLFFHEVMD